METLVKENKQKVIFAKSVYIDAAICYIDIQKNTVHYADNTKIQFDNVINVCKALQCNNDYGYVWNDALMFANNITKARYFVNFKIIENIYTCYNYFNVNDYNNISSSVELLAKFKHYKHETCFLNISKEYVFSFINSMNDILGYNPFMKDLN